MHVTPAAYVTGNRCNTVQVYMSTSDARQITSLLADSVQSSCVARSNVEHRGWAIPRAVATRRLRTALTGHPQHAPASDLLLTSLLSGTVKMRSSVSELTTAGVHFSDGTYVDNIDTIICATGHFPSSSGLSDGLMTLHNRHHHHHYC